MSPTARRTSAERRRLLGLRRAVHYTTAVPSIVARKPGSVTPGTTPEVAR